MKLAEVHTLYETNCRDIPDMITGLAESIASEDPKEHDVTTGVVAIRVKESGEIETYGWGDADELKSMALLQLALQQMTSSYFARQS